ncbi:MAG: cysteine desulfurase [Candidatus Aenigmarchaeota archaeon]|nr:cysteine desulfurase [Candidatus Aenigmarchaeota archaeon]
MESIYLDHSATTYVRPEVLKSMISYFSEYYGNPGSMHRIGLTAKQAIDTARKITAEILNCDPEEIIFTGSGTESINMAIQGIAERGDHIITTNTEHHAVLHTCQFLEKRGVEVTYLPVNQKGLITPEQVEKAIKKNTKLITIAYANNEIGVIQPISQIGNISKKRKIYFHTDACQAGLYLDLNIKNLNVDMMTLNSSKVYGPKGVGMLFVDRSVKIRPILFGGSQEQGLRPGTENVPGIVGFATALKIGQKEKQKENIRLENIRDYLIQELLKISDTKLNGDPKKRLPNNVNVSFDGVEGESIILRLDEKGFCVSTGSACTSRSLEPSHVIQALYGSDKKEIAHGSIRITLGKKTTMNNARNFVEVIKDVVSGLREISPVYK